MQAEMNKLFAEGGVMQEGGTVDPVSGNDVPPGAMQEEVRDDIPAQLSEGEFVFPADVVRFIGLQTLMMMRDKAKKGLQRMNDIGQMGNAEEVEDGEALFGGGEGEMDDDAFSSEIDSIMAEDSGGETREYNAGGYVVPQNQQKYSRAPMKGFEMVPMVNDAGQTIFIPFINGVAQLGIPTGYKVKEAGVTETPTAPVAPATGGGDIGGGGGDGGGGGGDGDGGGGGATASDPGFSIGDDGFAVANETSSTVGSVVGAVIGMMTGLPASVTSQVGKAAVNQSNFSNAQAAMGFNVAVSDTTAVANNEGVTSAAATTGPSGTGGAAAAAAAAAASAAAANGLSDAAQGAASQAAASATVAGATPSEAAAAGQAAAADAAMSEAVEGAVAAEAEAGFTAPGMDAGQPDGGGDEGSDGDAGASVSGEAGWAKGGLVSKRKKPTKSTKQKGLASRR